MKNEKMFKKRQAQQVIHEEGVGPDDSSMTGITLQEDDQVSIKEVAGQTKLSFKSRINRFKSKGELKKIDNRFKKVINENGEISEFKNRRNAFNIRISSKMSKKATVVFEDETHKISLMPQGQSIQGTMLDNTVMFKKFNGNDDLNYISESSCLKEEIIIRQPRKEYKYEFKMQLKNLKPVLNEDKSITFSDSNTGVALFRMPSMFMFDDSEVQSEDIDLVVKQEGTEFTLLIDADNQWINAPERKFPVTIDPTIELINSPALIVESFFSGILQRPVQGKLKLGRFEGRRFDLKLTVDAGKIVDRLLKDKITSFDCQVELTLAKGNRLKISNGFNVFCSYGDAGETLIANNSFDSQTGKAYIDITSQLKTLLAEVETLKDGNLTAALKNISPIRLVLLSKDEDLTQVKSFVEEEVIKNREADINDYVQICSDIFDQEESRPSLNIYYRSKGFILKEAPTLDFDLGRAGQATVHLTDGEFEHIHSTAIIKSNSLTIPINHVYSSNYFHEKNCQDIKARFGKGWKSNLHQRLMKVEHYNELIGAKNVTYIDGNNHNHILYEKWFYELDDMKCYVPKEKVYLGYDNKLRFIDSKGSSWEVKYEVTSEDGLQLISAESLLNYNTKEKLGEPRGDNYYINDEIRENDEKIKSYENSIDDLRINGASDELISKYRAKVEELVVKKNGLIQLQKERVCDFIVDKDGNSLGFDYYGKLIMITDKYKNQIDIIYNYEQMVEIKSNEESIKLYYGKRSRLLTHIVDNEGRKTLFKYTDAKLMSIIYPSSENKMQNTAENLKPITKFTYKYLTNDLLTIRNQTGSILQFTYDERKGITKISKQNNVATISNNEVVVLEEPIIIDEIEIDNRINFKISNYLRIISDTKGNKNTYILDNLGRLLRAETVDGDLQFRHFEDGNIVFEVETKKSKILYSNQDIRLGKTSKLFKSIDIIEKGQEISKRILRDKLPTSNLVLLVCDFANIDSSIEFTLEAKVSYKAESKFFKYHYINIYNNRIVMPIILDKDKVQKIEIIMTSSKEILATTLQQTSLYAAEGNIYSYDFEKNLSEVENGNLLTKYEDYDNGNPCTIKTFNKLNPALNNICHYNYDNQGRVRYFENIFGDCRETMYDEKGHIIETREYNKEYPTDARITKTTYDEKGNVTAVANTLPKSDGSKTEAEVSYSNGNVIKSKALNGLITDFGYDFDDDTLTEMSTVVDGRNNSNRMKYRFGLLTQVSHNGLNVNYVYDGLGRPKNINVNGQTFADFAYKTDATSTKVTSTSAKGLVIEAIADNHGLLVSTKEDGIETNYEYDEEKRLTSKISTNGDKEEITYNKYGNVSNHKINEESISFKKETIYDKTQRVEKSLLSIDGKVYSTQSLGYDFKERINQVVSNELTTAIEYDHLNRVSTTKLETADGELIGEQFSYVKHEDNVTELIRERHQSVKGLKTNTSIYDYDESGNIINIVNDDNETRYAYDKLNRLIREDNKQLGQTFIFKYDAGGNISLKKTLPYSLEDILVGGTKDIYEYRSTGWRDQLISYNGKSIDYDKFGRPINYLDMKDLVWSKKNELLSIGENISYEYNKNGIRNKKFIDGKQTKYIVLDSTILKETTDNYELAYHYTLDKLTGFTYNDNKELRQYFYVRNIFGDITQIIDDKGEVKAQYIYDAWGNHQIYDGEGNLIKEGENEELTIGEINPFRYRGYYYDREMGYGNNTSGLYYLNLRYYDPNTGRFISPDSLEYLDPQSINGLNLYSYCGNNPIMRIDPLGNAWWNPTTWNWNKIGQVALVVGIAALTITLVALTAGAAAAAVGFYAPLLAASAGISMGTAITIGAVASAATLIAAGVVIGGIATFAIAESISIGFDTGNFMGFLGSNYDNVKTGFYAAAMLFPYMAQFAPQKYSTSSGTVRRDGARDNGKPNSVYTYNLQNGGRSDYIYDGNGNLIFMRHYGHFDNGFNPHIHEFTWKWYNDGWQWKKLPAGPWFW